MTSNVYLRSALNDTDLASLKDLLDKSEIQISFWGSRIVTVEGYSDSVNLGLFTQKLIDLTGTGYPPRNFILDLSLAERASALKARAVLEKHYRKADDELIQTMGFLTRIFFAIQQFLNIYNDYDEGEDYNNHNNRAKVLVHCVYTSTDNLNYRLRFVPPALLPADASQDEFEYEGESFIVFRGGLFETLIGNSPKIGAEDQQN